MKIECDIDVTDSVGSGEELQVHLTVVLEPQLLAEDADVYFGYPGGGYSRLYYDLQPRGHTGYSQAEYHASLGDVFVCCDHLGVGASKIPTNVLDFDAVGRANAHAAQVLVERLKTGRLLDGLAAIRPRATVGIGQSYGGFVLTIGQAVDPVFDGLVILGWSGLRTNPPWREDRDLEMIMAGTAPDGLDHPMRPFFHHGDEPEDLVLMDMRRPNRASGCPEEWGANLAPGGPAVVSRGLLEPGVVSTEAALISVPVFIGCGEIDVVGDPWSEPSAYRGSRDVTIAVFRRMAHMHNFAPTRRRLWDRLRVWAEALAI